MRPLGLPDEIGVAVHVHDVVEVAWAAPFAQRAQLLPEQLDKRVPKIGCHTDVQRLLGPQVEELAGRDHEGSSGSTRTLTRNPQRVTRRPSFGPSGSSSEMPAEMRSRQAATNSA
jgi:hypothetical protein